MIGVLWIIKEIHGVGFWDPSQSYQYATSWTLDIYSSAPGPAAYGSKPGTFSIKSILDDDLSTVAPNQLLYTTGTITPPSGNGAENPKFELDPPFNATEGTYWISYYANLSGGTTL
jgi:hypothetical protein